MTPALSAIWAAWTSSGASASFFFPNSRSMAFIVVSIGRLYSQ